MPPETERTAGVFVLDPIKTPESASEVRIVLPEPADVMVRLLFPVVVMSGFWPPVKVRLKPLKLVVPVVPIVPNPLMVLAELFADILPMPEILLLAPVMSPPSVKAFICNVPPLFD